MSRSVLLTSLILSYLPVVLHSQPLDILNPALPIATVEAGTIGPSMPVRISRSFFDNALIGKVTVTSSDSKLHYVQESPISWIEEDPTDPAPGSDAIADFRDFRACATYENMSNPVAICFNVMPDVSSVKVNSDDTQLLGIESLANAAFLEAGDVSGCTYSISNLQIQKIDRTSDFATIDYVGQAVPVDSCEAPLQTVHFKLELQKT